MAEFDSLVGQQIDHYQVIEQIGEGGMAAVYLARDLTLDRQVVLKTLLPALSKDVDLMRRFEREAKATARLEHPNIVPVYTTSKTPSGQPYIAMQYIEGGSLSDHLARLSEQKKWISAIYALAIIRQIADALHIAHQAGIVHRDLKPSNILLRGDGTPVLADLGIAAVQQATTRLTQSGSIIGTPNYMSPEQGAGQEIDGRSDIYSLGIILYEMLSGQLPFDADSPWAMIHQHIYEPPNPLKQFRPDLSPQTLKIVETCLQKKPGARYKSANDLVAALNQALAAEGGSPIGPVIGRRPTVRQIALPISLLILLFVGYLLFLDNPSPSIPSTDVPATLSSTVAAATSDIPTIDDIVTTAAITAVTETPGLTTNPTNEPPTVTATAANPFPNGLIAYSCGIGPDSGNNRLFLSSPDGSFQLEIPNQPGNSVVPAFSRDGRQIAYRSNAGGNYQIYVSNLDGSNRRQITSADYNNYEAVWSPDDSQFAFVSDRDVQRQIYIMNSDGSNQTRLSFNEAYNDDPSWSINDEIIFESNVNGRFSIFQVLPSGGTPLELINLGSSSSTPAWSHDGQWLAFESLANGDRDIWITRRGGSNPRRVVALGSSDERPAWSPDGTNIAVHTNYLQVDISNVDIWVVNIDTQVPIRLTNSGNCYDPSWAIIPIDMLVNLITIDEPTSLAPNGPEVGNGPCPLNSGMTVTAGDGARFWSQPDVYAGSIGQSIATGTSLRVIGGPTWGPIRLDSDDEDWWWQLETFDGTVAGWLWELRLDECLNTGE